MPALFALRKLRARASALDDLLVTERADGLEILVRPVRTILAVNKLEQPGLCLEPKTVLDGLRQCLDRVSLLDLEERADRRLLESADVDAPETCVSNLHANKRAIHANTEAQTI